MVVSSSNTRLTRLSRYVSSECVSDLRTQLHDAWRQSGLTLEQLRDKAALKTTIVSLSRKLRGKQSLRTEEWEALAEVLGLRSPAPARCGPEAA